MNRPVIFDLETQDKPQRIGNKAEKLSSLMEIRHIKVPKTCVVSWDAYQQYLHHGDSVMDEIENNLHTFLDPKKSYAVRSSSNIEDGKFHSFAGLFKTFLNVRGFEEVRNAVIEVWAATQSETVKIYLEKRDISPDQILMSVIIQEMVHPVYSGVLFSRNPMTGTNEIVIEGVKGEGVALVQDGVTPERWISRQGSWIAKPENGLMPSRVPSQVLNEAQKIFKKYDNPIDLEWVYDGQDVWWVQMREITTLRSLNIYSNRLSRDMMPGMIHPLIWSINIPLVNSEWLALLEEMVGKLPISSEALAKSFFYRSYFNMGAFGEVFTKIGLPSEGLEMMMGVVPSQEGRPTIKPNIKMLHLVPRLIRFLSDKWRFERKIKSDLPTFKSEIGEFTPNPDPGIPMKAQVKEINHLYQVLQKIVYLNIVTPLLVSMYVRMLEQQLEKMDVDFLEFDLLENMPELDPYNPNAALANLQRIYHREIANEEVVDENEGLYHQNDHGFKKHFTQFINDFGHFSENSNNFMAVPWREDPDLVMQMIREFPEANLKKNKRVGFDDLGTRGFRKHLIKLFYQRARKFTLYRDRVSHWYVYGYGLFRPYFFRLADSMVAAGWMNTRKDIFYLAWAELQDAVKRQDGSGLNDKINDRKSEMDSYRDINLPEVIYGDDPPPVFPIACDRMKGTPTSQGYYAGYVKVIASAHDFKKVESGDVIVIPYSDVGWTPLFTRAGAVIAESGGLLSHSSIIAREYQIPAVVSVQNCMQLKDLQRVGVNGFTGEIVLLDEEISPSEE